MSENAAEYKTSKLGKPPVHLVDPRFIEGLAMVLDFGNEKHGFQNWKKGVNYTDVIAAVKRHIASIECGIDIDPETEQHHAYHAAAGLMYLTWFHRNGITGIDDRIWDGEHAKV